MWRFKANVLTRFAGGRIARTQGRLDEPTSTSDDQCRDCQEQTLSFHWFFFFDSLAAWCPGFQALAFDLERRRGILV
jgi:hypothetical protein